MDITSIGNISNLATYDSNGTLKVKGTNLEAFNSVLQSAVDMLKETNSLANDARQATIDFVTGNATSTHDLTVAQQKALTSIQYTAAVRNAVVDAYKEIMQLQF